MSGEFADRDRKMIITLYAKARDGRLRYYTIHDRQPSLESPYTLTAAWRAENSREREWRYFFKTSNEMNRKIRTLFRKTARRGYKLLYSFDRDGFGRFGLNAYSLRVLEDPPSEIKGRKRA